MQFKLILGITIFVSLYIWLHISTKVFYILSNLFFSVLMSIHTYKPMIHLTRPLPFFPKSITLVASKLIYIYCHPPPFTPNLIAKIHNLYLFQNYPYFLVFSTFTIFPSTLRWCCILFHRLFLFAGKFYLANK